MPKAKSPDTNLPLDALYNQQLRDITDELRRKAALAAFEQLRPSNRTTVEDFLTSLKQSKEVWAAVAALGIVDFAEAIIGRRSIRSEPADREATRRTRLSEPQKMALQSAIADVLSRNKDGLNRQQIAQALDAAQVEKLGLDHGDLADKLRQPLARLITENKIHSVGEKRLLKYFSGSTPKKK